MNSLLREGTRTLVLGKGNSPDYRVFAQRFDGDFAKGAVLESKKWAESMFGNCLARGEFLKYNPQTGEINGSSIFLVSAIQSSYLCNYGLRVPDLDEASIISRKTSSELSPECYRDCGLIVHDGETEFFDPLINKVRDRIKRFPALIDMRSLALIRPLSPSEYGVNFTLQDDAQIVSGDDALSLVEFFGLNSFDNPGVFRITNFESPPEFYVTFLGSNENGRIDWVCGEAHVRDLERLVKLEQPN